MVGNTIKLEARMLNLNYKRKAEITIEITLSVALSIVVLFLVLGLFSDNLSTMAANSGIKHLFNNNSSAKTMQTNWNVNPTQTQMNVQTIADQGLQGYVNNAQTTISKYVQNAPTTEAQIEDMAKKLTILAINANSFDGNKLKTKYYSGDTNITPNQINNLKTMYLSKYQLNLQDDDANYYGETQLKNNGKFITYNSIYDGSTLPISIIKEVLRKNF